MGNKKRNFTVCASTTRAVPSSLVSMSELIHSEAERLGKGSRASLSEVPSSPSSASSIPSMETPIDDDTGLGLSSLVDLSCFEELDQRKELEEHMLVQESTATWSQEEYMTHSCGGGLLRDYAKTICEGGG